MIRRRLAPWLFLAPFLLLFAGFTVWPLLRSIWLSLHISAGPAYTRWVGLDNYAYLIADPSFWHALGNTAVYAVAFVCLQLPVALILALLVDARRLRCKAVFRWAFFCPHLVGTVFVAVMFQKLFERGGWFNKAFGLEINWLNDPSWAMVALVGAGLWLSVGYAMIYLLAALQAVDRELHEAARMDGANAWQRFWHVTLPSIRPTIVFLALVSAIGACQLFELPFVLFKGTGTPADSTLTVVGYLYREGFELGNLGYACAVGWALTAIIALAAVAQVRVTRFHQDQA